MEGKYDRIEASTQNTELSSQLFRIMRRKKECNIEELVEECGSYPWEQVLLEVVRLNRTGELRVVYKQSGDDAIRLPPIQSALISL
jgi:hypothetical protein